MTLAELEQKVARLEADLQQLKTQVAKPNKADPKWVLAHAGRFKDDPGFDDVVRLGREYRESLSPGGKHSRKKKAKPAVKHGRA